MTPSEALELIADLRDSFPGQRFPVESVKAYARAVADLPIDVGRAAIAELVAESERLPTIAQIRRRAVLVQQPARDRGKSWDQAWADVIAAIRKLGRYRQPKFGDPRTAAAVRAMDWQTLCSVQERDLPTVRAQFRQAWEHAADREMHHAVTESLPALPALPSGTPGGLIGGIIRHLTAGGDSDG